MCGENLAAGAVVSMKPGSPPRVRGKPASAMCAPPTRWITPACAGKTTRIFEIFQSPRDHPRVCGENSTEFTPAARCRGSPPRVRGKLIVGNLIRHACRITPACAGKTFNTILLSGEKKDHPRVCGENRILVGYPGEWTGSPPRVRGKPTRMPPCK